MTVAPCCCAPGVECELVKIWRGEFFALRAYNDQMEIVQESRPRGTGVIVRACQIRAASAAKALAGKEAIPPGVPW